LKVPDFLIIPFDIREKAIGIEVGGGKETQSTKFSLLTWTPISTKVNADNPKRCPICGKWILFCPMIIDRFSNLDFEIADMTAPVKCLKECNIYSKEDIRNGKCPYSSVKGVKPEKHVMKFKYDPKRYHYHLRCALNDPQASKMIREENIVTYYPYVKGLEDLENLITREDKTYIIEKLKKKIKELENQLEKRRPKLTDFIKKQ